MDSPAFFFVAEKAEVADRCRANAACSVFYMRKPNEIALIEKEIAKAYAEALRSISMLRGMFSDETRQYMADAIREFYYLLDARIEAKRCSSPKSGEQSLSQPTARAQIAR